MTDQSIVSKLREVIDLYDDGINYDIVAEDGTIVFSKADFEETFNQFLLLQDQVNYSRELMFDAKTTLTSWFDVSAKVEADLLPDFNAAVNGYYRTSVNGGMDVEDAERCKTIIHDIAEVILGRVVTPYIQTATKELRELLAATKVALKLYEFPDGSFEPCHNYNYNPGGKTKCPEGSNCGENGCAIAKGVFGAL